MKVIVILTVNVRMDSGVGPITVGMVGLVQIGIVVVDVIVKQKDLIAVMLNIHVLKMRVIVTVTMIVTVGFFVEKTIVKKIGLVQLGIVVLQVSSIYLYLLKDIRDQHPK